jgi:hypothetical protein
MSETEQKEVLMGMSRKELLDMAANDFGEDLPANMKKEDLISEIMKLMGYDSESESGELQAEETEVKKMYKLILNSDDKAGGNANHPVGVNGHVWSIPRDVEVEVPEEVVNVLKEAMTTITEQKGTDDDGKPIYTDRDVRRFSFSVTPV